MSTLQIKRGTAARLNELGDTLVLKAGEPCQEYDTGKMKIGDGTSTWNQLPYIGHQFSDVIARNTYNELNEIEEKDVNVIYKVNDSKMLYQWNSTSNEYEPLTGGGTFDPNSIKLINGGNANG